MKRASASTPAMIAPTSAVPSGPVIVPRRNGALSERAMPKRRAPEVLEREPTPARPGWRRRRCRAARRRRHALFTRPSAAARPRRSPAQARRGRGSPRRAAAWETDPVRRSSAVCKATTFWFGPPSVSSTITCLQQRSPGRLVRHPHLDAVAGRQDSNGSHRTLRAGARFDGALRGAHDDIQTQRDDLGSDPVHERIVRRVHDQEDATAIFEPRRLRLRARRPRPGCPKGARSKRDPRENDEREQGLRPGRSRPGTSRRALHLDRIPLASDE